MYILKVFNTLFIEIKHKSWKIPFGQNKCEIKCTFFCFAVSVSNSSQFYFKFAIPIWAESQCLSL